MTERVPDNYSMVYSALYIDYMVDKVASDINRWISLHSLQAKSKPIMCLCVLKGAVHFFNDLMKRITGKIEYGFIQPKSYINNQQLEDITILEHNLDVLNRRIILVDDIMDTGDTIYKLSKCLYKEGAKYVASAALIHRKGAQKADVSPGWACIEHEGDEWFVGYGMDDCEFNRNLRNIYKLER